MVKGGNIILFLLLILILHTLMQTGQVYGQQIECHELDPGTKSLSLSESETYTAVNDTFHFIRTCDRSVLTGTVINNDQIKSNSISVCYVFSPRSGLLTFGTQGRFTFTPQDLKSGLVTFNYRLCNSSNHETYSEAVVHIFVEHDSDCDGVVDELDQDNDNDGIPDAFEKMDGKDSDLDGCPDYLDIDSDNDGITDLEEWQAENAFVYPSDQDLSRNGWDNAYDQSSGGIWSEPEDTDSDLIPDYLDTDSDNDGLPDHVEAFDLNRDEIPEVYPLNIDSDNDGLDDAYDTLQYAPNLCNAIGSCAPLPDLNKNGIREWRDKYVAIVPQEENPVNPMISNYKIYPNPSAGQFIIEIPEVYSGQYTLKVFYPNGANLTTRKLNHGINHIKLDPDLSGLFILRISSQIGQHHSKILLTR